MIKQIIKTKRFWIGLILLISLGANLFFFGKQWIQKERQRNFNTGVIWVFEQAKRLGRVTYTTMDGEVIILELK